MRREVRAAAGWAPRGGPHLDEQEREQLVPADSPAIVAIDAHEEATDFLNAIGAPHGRQPLYELILIQLPGAVCVCRVIRIAHLQDVLDRHVGDWDRARSLLRLVSLQAERARQTACRRLRLLHDSKL